MGKAMRTNDRWIAAVVFAGAASLTASSAPAQSTTPPAGEAVYAEHCALCHEQVDARIPHRQALQQLPAARIVRALDAGAMLAIAMTMNRDERLAVADYLGTDAPDTGPSPAAFCTDRTVTLAATPRMAWNGYIEAPTHGTYRIEDLVLGRTLKLETPPLIV